jgi:hypothetical protein
MSTPADTSKGNLAEGSSATFLVRWKGRQEGPFPADLIGAKLADNEIGLLHEIFHNGQWVTIRDFLAEKKNSNPNFQIVLATEKQKEKLRFFGCTWDEGITAGQAKEALEKCARQFPDAEATWWKNQPAREDQKEKLRYFGCTWNGDINVGQAIDALLQCAIDFPDREAAWNKWGTEHDTDVKRGPDVSQPEVKREGFYPATPENVSLQEVTIQEAPKPDNTNPSEYTIPAREVQNYTERSAGPSGKVGKFVTKEPKRPKYISYPREPRRQSFNSGLDFDYAYDNAKTNWIAEVKTIEAENRRRHDIYCAAIKSWYVQHNWNTDWEPLPFPKSPLTQNASLQEGMNQDTGSERKDFALDMKKVYEIDNETKELAAILSPLMEDEPAKTITLPESVTVTAPEIPHVSSDGIAVPQPTRFNGLDAAFHPILERLLARGTWPQADFNSLAREFCFMPLNIRDTLNEWAYEVLGDFILDGEDPVVIRRELMAKETIQYG